MAKQKRSAADLDAELAALEAELAALEGKPKKASPKAAPKVDAAPAPVPEPAPEPRGEKKGRFAMPPMPKLGRRKAPEPTAPAPEAAPAQAPAPVRAQAPARAPAPTPSYDPSLWRQEGDAWVRVVPETPVPVVRRVLDENGNLVREEVASMRDVDEASGVKAERGLGRLLRRK